MTDMRATERLLEVIENCARELPTLDPTTRSAILTIQSAITELRRRGDTLVRRDDLLRVLESSGTPLLNPSSVNPELLQARHRLENALGGKLR